MKRLLLVLAFSLACTGLLFGMTITNNDITYVEGEDGEMPILFSYVYEEKPYFQQDTHYFNGKASAKIGTLTLSWNPSCHDGNGNKFANFNYDDFSKNLLFQLYMASGIAGQLKDDDDRLPSSNFRANEATYETGKGQAKTLDIYLACVYFNGTRSKGLSKSTNGGTYSTDNFYVFKGNDTRLSLPMTIDFYLVTKESFVSNLKLFNSGNSEKNIKIYDASKEVWRDVLRWSYRINPGQGASGKSYRFVSKLTSRPFSLFSPHILEYGMNYNQAPDEVYVPLWIFDLVPTGLNTNVSVQTNEKQKVAEARVWERNDEGGAYAFTYIFTDTSDSTLGSAFALKRVGAPTETASIPFSLYFDPHGSEALVKGKEYIWSVKKTPETAGLYVGGLKDGAKDIRSGTWSDTVTITIKATDSTGAENT
jgi:hypothetical protein